MFRKHEDGTYAFSGRVWIYVVIASVLICFIGWRTQTTADRTEALNRETVDYARQTNDCLAQVTKALAIRADTTKQLDSLVDARSSVIDRRSDVWEKFIVDLAQISTDLPQSQRDELAKPIISTFIADDSELDTENAKINTDRASALAYRAANPYPDPNCGNKLPGQ